jgi:hypothetical protein
MHRRQQFSTFQSYLKDRERRIKRASSEIEKRGAAAALDKSRVPAEQIDGDLRNKKFKHLFNNISLQAEFQVESSVPPQCSSHRLRNSARTLAARAANT